MSSNGMILFFSFCDFSYRDFINYIHNTPTVGKEKKSLHMFQAYVHGDEGCAED